MQDTRQRILDAALDLFSQSGYAAVSIRDICARVQVREGTIYYHFSNKQAIAEELFREFAQRAEELMAPLEAALGELDRAPGEGFPCAACDALLESYFLDGFCNRVLRFLSIERFRSARARELYDRWMFQAPLAFQERVFAQLLALQAVSGADGARLALRFYAPLLLLAQRWLFGGALTPENRERFRAEAREHIRQFFEEIGGQRG
ncbi:MAG: TetR family transcriptional regulator [Candidatus Spyradocola sp.]|jgi:AcrR family transcriptional regulator